MAQSLKLISIDDEIKVWNGSLCDKNDIEEYAYDYGTGKHYYETWWFAIGEGENGLDEFISENEIGEMLYNGADIDDIIKVFEEKGYDVELIQSDRGEIEIESDDPEDYYDNDIDSDCGFDAYMGCYTYDC